jgi:hypothetical protein
MMDPIYYYLFGATIVVFIALGWYLRVKGRKELEQQGKLEAEQMNSYPVVQQTVHKPTSNPEMLRLQLQAYERLIILTERLGLQNLLSRFDVNSANAAQMQQQLIQTIRSEFEYNVSQQLYVSTQAWDAVSNLKEQNIFIINQLSNMVKPEAPALELGQKVAELLAADENASLQPVVASLLRKEAKELMQG